MKQFNGRDLASIKAVSPDIEVIVRIGELEIAVIGLFQNKRGVWDVIIGVDDVDRRESLATLFTTVATAIPSATFGYVRSTGAAGDEGPTDETPQ